MKLLLVVLLLLLSMLVLVRHLGLGRALGVRRRGLARVELERRAPRLPAAPPPLSCPQSSHNAREAHRDAARHTHTEMLPDTHRDAARHAHAK
eukprot:3938565-Rhodomonas_salina.1